MHIQKYNDYLDSELIEIGNALKYNSSNRIKSLLPLKNDKGITIAHCMALIGTKFEEESILTLKDDSGITVKDIIDNVEVITSMFRDTVLNEEADPFLPLLERLKELVDVQTPFIPEVYKVILLLNKRYYDYRNIAIHKEHLKGVPSDTIALKFNMTTNAVDAVIRNTDRDGRRQLVKDWLGIETLKLGPIIDSVLSIKELLDQGKVIVGSNIKLLESVVTLTRKNRDVNIFKDKMMGFTLTDIGTRYNVTPSNASRIYDRECISKL